MSNAVFPSLAGLGWPVVKTPNFATKVQASVSFRELRAAFAPYPQWRWNVVHNFLRIDPTTPDFQTLANFYLARQGMFDSFLYSDPTDNTVTGQQFATGDGATTAFQLLRTFSVAGFAEFVYNLNGVPVIKDNGVVKTAGVDYNIVNGLVTFTAPVSVGHALTWTGGYYWRARFDTDAPDFTNFNSAFWSQGGLAFKSVIGS
jgi:uncharacterized protein (TIGR02217 family)